MAVAALKELWKNEYVKTAVMFILIIVIVFGFWYGSQLVLNSQYPALAVATGSMCMVQPNRCDGWTHPFEQTLHVGDLIIVQGIDPKNIQTAYGTGDIIVFHKPKTSEGASDELIVHRAVANETNPANGLVYFETKGDGNSGPDAFDYDYRGEDYAWHNKISEKLVVGKVLLRVPWVGHVALFMHNNVSGMFVIVLLLIVLIVIEFVIPEVTRKKPEAGKTEEAAKTFEDKPL